MSSLIMHVYISNIIRKKYDFSYEFLYGSIMPDILKKSGEDKNKVHYRTNNDYSLYEIDKFIKEKLTDNKSEYNLGYLAHLIQDKLFSQYMDKKIKDSIVNNQEYITYIFDNNSLHKKDEFLNLIYNEYAIIDDYLIKKYDVNLEYLTKRILRINQNEKFVPIIKKELEVHVINNKELKMINIVDIEQYIHECVREFEKYIEDEL